ETNAEHLGCLDDCILIQAEAESFIRKTSERFDLIFADPPYVYEGTQLLPQQVFEKGLLKKDGYLIIEHTKHAVFPEIAGYGIAVTKEFGTTHVSFFTERLS